jgi:hypothetical protein
MNLFAAGFLFMKTPVTAANPNPTPRNFGQLQEIQFEDNFDTQQLFGTGSAPLREFRGHRKPTVKAKYARINLSLWSESFYGGTVSTGASLIQFQEVQTVPTTPFQITIAPPSSGTFDELLSVTYADGTPLKLVASGPTQGQYTQAAGLLTFATADAGAIVLLSYSYTVTTGQKVNVPTTLQQEAPYFEVVLGNPTDGGFQRRLFKCSSSKLSASMKQGEIVYPDFEITVLDPGTGVLYADNLATP